MVEHDQILIGLARVEEQVKGSNLRLDKIDGSIVRLFARVELSESNLLKHEISCPIKAIVTEIDRALSTGDHPGSAEVRKRLEMVEAAALVKEAMRTEAKKVSDQWWHRIKPAILWAGLLVAGAFFALVVSHFDTVLTWYGKKP